MSFFNKFTWCIILVYCLYVAVIKNKEKENVRRRKLENILYVITGLMGIVLIDLFYIREIPKKMLDFLVPACFLGQLVIIGKIESSKITNKTQRMEWNKQAIKSALTILFVAVIFLWLLWT